jgi:CO dehydrogenase maturation factor
MKRIIFTGKGGVGKTTILSTVARLLAREGHRVMVVDCDPSMNLAMSLGIPIYLVKFLINHLTSNSEEFDFIMVDSRAGVEILGRGLSSEFDLSLVITEPTPKSIEVARHSMKLSRDLGVKKQMVIVNMAEDESECRSIADALDLNGDLIDAVRYDPQVVEADKMGVTSPGPWQFL